MDYLLKRLDQAVGDRYRVVRPLGAGGMAVVFLAEDVKHDRTVAIKVLRPEVASTIGIDRFLREIRITAQLDHPHILPLLDSGEADGLPYYVMPHVEGESVRDRLDREGRFALDDALRIVRQVGDALEYAHARGIVHRDIKPDNVLLAGRHARVADFGVARAVFAAGGDWTTGSGFAVGTPEYMSPESAGGEPTDARADVYALGCLCYELLAATPPFSGPTAQSVLAQHLAKPAPSLQAVRPDVPPRVDTAVRHAMAKDPAKRSRSVAAFLEELGPEVEPAGRHWRTVGTVGLVGLALIGAAALIFANGLPRRDPPRLAVLPLEERNAADSATYFAQGLTEALGIVLSRLEGVTVVAHESARRFRASDIEGAVERLRLDHVVVGSVQRDRGTIRITVRLVSADGAQHWGETYVRSLTMADLFVIEQDVAEHVARGLTRVFAPVRASEARGPPTTSLAAYDLYLLGRSYWNRRGPQNLARAARYFEQALAEDPDFARAYVALAQTYLLFPVYGATEIPPADAVERAETLVREALARDSTLGEAYAALGLLQETRHHDWPGAAAAFERAVALTPGSATAHQWYGEHLLVARRLDPALAELRRAYDLDPESPAVSNALAIALYVTGDDAGALEQTRRTLATDPAYLQAHLLSAAVWDRMGRHDSVAAALERSGLPAPAVAALVAGIRDSTQTPRAIATVAALEASVPLPTAAALYAGIGADDAALAVMERALATPGTDLSLVFAPLPLYERVMRTERYRGMLARLGVAVERR